MLSHTCPRCPHPPSPAHTCPHLLSLTLACPCLSSLALSCPHLPIPVPPGPYLALPVLTGSLLPSPVLTGPHWPSLAFICPHLPTPVLAGLCLPSPVLPGPHLSSLALAASWPWALPADCGRAGQCGSPESEGTPPGAGPPWLQSLPLSPDSAVTARPSGGRGLGGARQGPGDCRELGQPSDPSLSPRGTSDLGCPRRGCLTTLPLVLVFGSRDGGDEWKSDMVSSGPSALCGWNPVPKSSPGGGV